MSNPNALLSFARTLHQTHGGSFRQSEGNRPLRATTGANLKTEAAQNAPNLNALKNGISSKTGSQNRAKSACERTHHARKNAVFALLTRNFPHENAQKSRKNPILRSKEKPPAYNLRRLVCGRDTLCAADFRKPRGRLAGKTECLPKHADKIVQYIPSDALSALYGLGLYETV